MFHLPVTHSFDFFDWIDCEVLKLCVVNYTNLTTLFVFMYSKHLPTKKKYIYASQ